MEKLNILWTNADIDTSRNMVFMYAGNSIRLKWWSDVTVIVWGATARLIKENAEIQNDVQKLMSTGVEVIACKACADNIGATKTLESLGIKTEYLGEYLTDAIKSTDSHLITV
jgi:hypothetical protein